MYASVHGAESMCEVGLSLIQKVLPPQRIACLGHESTFQQQLVKVCAHAKREGTYDKLCQEFWLVQDIQGAGVPSRETGLQVRWPSASGYSPPLKAEPCDFLDGYLSQTTLGVVAPPLRELLLDWSRPDSF